MAPSQVPDGVLTELAKLPVNPAVRQFPEAPVLGPVALLLQAKAEDVDVAPDSSHYLGEDCLVSLGVTEECVGHVCKSLPLLLV